jgi:hypothetical protein
VILKNDENTGSKRERNIHLEGTVSLAEFQTCVTYTDVTIIFSTEKIIYIH